MGTLTTYLDASVLVAMLTDDPLSDRADALFRGKRKLARVSDFAVAEFSSAVARRVRTGELSRESAREVFADMDAWRARSAQFVPVQAADISAATTLVRRLDPPLRTPDALNIAIAQRIGAALATFDLKMAQAARVLGVEVIDGLG